MFLVSYFFVLFLVEFSDGVCQVSKKIGVQNVIISPQNKTNKLSLIVKTIVWIFFYMYALFVYRFLGPAEVVTWVLLGYVWTLFGSFSDGFADAAELRCTYHLDMNRPEKAKSSAYKSIYLGLHCGIFCTHGGPSSRR